jgi:alkanesulfonate monooxygenase SsuD/methylene tetrahydromethanopterin reductase-like flavin-dependent oxidoreductase (luciferase family)
VTPRPRQRPHPPLFIAANSTESNLSAARLGLPTLSSFFVPAAELHRRRDLFRSEALAAGHDAATVQALHEQSCGMRCVFVARDRAEAVATVQGPFMAYQERLAARRNVRERLGYGYLRPFEEYIEEGLASFGGPEEVAESLRRYAAETGYERVLILMALAGVPGAATLRSMELFAAEVMPRLTGVVSGL